ncbi:ubiquitin-conjugating enzyme/RWD-like protein [Lipomyces oligophaga]|uniref:ubiquitin-conjugating enzyme/RWD-like protein n=1 Tax=Lipomyces oligophaga TaxID=45792 RepID=UPI0034CE7910
MATRAAHKRLVRDYKQIEESPPPYIVAHPSEKNILIWHYVITGPPETPYEGGQYHGTLTFPSDFPFRPPSIRMITPSGRFQTNTRLCLSMSDFHPDTWTTSWSVSTILVGLLSFMTSDELTTGGLNTPAPERRRLAEMSKEWNALHSPRFAEQFPDLVEKNLAEVAAQKKLAAAKIANQRVTSRGQNCTSLDGSNEFSNGPNGTARSTDGAVTANGSNAGEGGKESGDEANRNWMRSHKVMCVLVVLFAWLVVSRISSSI